MVMFPRALRTLTCSLVAVTFGLMLASCAVREPADPDRLTSGAMTPIDPDLIQWPSRDPALLDSRIWMRPGRQRLYLAGLDDLRGEVKPYVWSGEVDVLCRKHAGLGVLCEVRRANEPREWYDPRLFVFYSSSTPVLAADRSKGPPPPQMHDLDGTPLDGMVYRWRPDARGVPADRGIVIALRPLSGSTYIKPVVNEARSRGWLVIESSMGFGMAGVGEKRDAADEQEIDRHARQIAQLVDARLSEWAYGAEAMLATVREERPELAGKPVVIMGFSAGAIGAPTVALRLGEQVKAAVLVGGGVNIMDIASTSELSNFGLGITFRGGPLGPEQRAIASRAYLDESRLDSYHTAATLRTLPVLVLHAAEDEIVPSRTGDMLHQRLGQPERWVFPVGHEMLFFQLGAFASPINDWLEAALAKSGRVAGSSD